MQKQKVIKFLNLVYKRKNLSSLRLILNHSKMGATTRKKFSSNSFSEKRSTEALKVREERKLYKYRGACKKSLKQFRAKMMKNYVDENAFLNYNEGDENSPEKKLTSKIDSLTSLHF